MEVSAFRILLSVTLGRVIARERKYEKFMTIEMIMKNLDMPLKLYMPYTIWFNLPFQNEKFLDYDLAIE